MHARPIAALASLTALLIAPSLSAQDEMHRSAHHSYRVVKVADSLANPWSMAFLPNGDVLFTERAGRLRLIRDGRLVATPIAGFPAAKVGSQGGYLDVVLHPQFAQNQWVYLSYSKASADGARNTTAVVRGRWRNDAITDVQEVLEADAWSTGQGHYGSRLAFDRNGLLFITIGDRQVPPEGNLEQHPSQNLMQHHGKTLRIHDDGRIPADNPFVGRTDALPQIWSYGHRNQQGLFVHPETNDVWATEHGPQGGDELNLLLPGRNYGWPVIGFGVNYRTGSAIHTGTMRAGMEQPVKIWVPSIATSGLMRYTGDKFPGWQGSVFTGGLNGEVLARLTMDGQRVTSEELLVQRRGRIRDVRQGTDGFIYLAMDGRNNALTGIYRLEPVR
jgi:glucose/arabinose dehydrogenase